jgi:hypothetical protein
VENRAAELLDAALEYVKRGWLVLPLHSPTKSKSCDCGRSRCPSPSKHPRTTNGLKDASINPETIREWWLKWPTANVGILTGDASGILVIDIDGPEGEKFLDANEWPKTLSVKTHKGRHYFLRHPGFRVKNSVRRLADAVDLRADDAYVVAPPSIHASGTVYKWEQESPFKSKLIADAPDWLLKRIQDPLGNSPRSNISVSRIVSKGNRNSHLISIAGGMRRQGLEREAILAALMHENEDKCDPPLQNDEVESIVDSSLRYEPAEKLERRISDSTKLLRLAAEIELFHYGDQGYATITVKTHKEHWFIRSNMFRRWLQKRFYETENRGLNSAALQEALETLEAKALYEGPEQTVYTRLAGYNGKIYLDIGNDRWEAIQVTTQGWKVISNPPVKFRRPRGMLALPVPTKGGAMKELRRFVNLDADAEVLLWAWLVAAIYSEGPYPILVLRGEQGSSKSTLARIIRELIDPNSCPLRAAPREERDLVIAAANGWIIALDNLSFLHIWLSDAICRVSTGGGFSTRQLHTDDEEKLFDVKRPICINGIEEFATRGDILDRALVLHLKSIPEEKRKTEKSFWEEFREAKPRILGALLDVLSDAIRRLPKTTLERLPRMADFAKLATAAEPVFNWAPGTFLKTYKAYAKDANSLALEASPIGGVVMRFMERQAAWEGTATDLLKLLDAETNHDHPPQGWPRSAQALTNALHRIEPHLRAMGVTFYSQRQRTRRCLFITYHPPKAPTSSTASTQTSVSIVDDVDDVDNRPRRKKIVIKRRPNDKNLD